MTARCTTPNAHPPLESWDPGRGIHTTTRRDCCNDPHPAEGACPTDPSGIDHEEN